MIHKKILHASAARHSHLCPRQVLGIRMGFAGLIAVGLSAPITKQTGLIIIESDGCFADGIEVSTGATIGHRTLIVKDFGKVAATFANVKTGRALRLAPAPGIRRRALNYAPDESRHYFGQLKGYQVMPDHEMFSVQAVILQPSLEILISRPGVRVNCDCCHEEIINERQVRMDETVLCRSCAGEGYYMLKANLVDVNFMESASNYIYSAD